MGASARLRKQIQKNNTPPPGGAISTVAQAAAPSQAGGQVPEGKKRQVEDVAAMLLTYVHGEDTSGSVMQLLQSQPDGRKAVPLAMNTIMKQVEKSALRKHVRIPDDIKLAAALPVIQDLALLGNQAQVWEQPIMKEELPDVIKDTLQIYIHQGLKNKTINPTKLQKEVEQLMNDDAKAQMMSYGKGQIPAEPTATMAAQQHTEKAVDKERQKNQALQEQLSALQSQAPAQQQVQQNPAQQGNPQAGALQQPVQ